MPPSAYRQGALDVLAVFGITNFKTSIELPSDEALALGSGRDAAMAHYDHIQSLRGTGISAEQVIRDLHESHIDADGFDREFYTGLELRLMRNRLDPGSAEVSAIARQGFEERVAAILSGDYTKPVPKPPRSLIDRLNEDV